MISLLWIEDDDQQMQLWAESIQTAFDVKARTSNHLEAIEIVRDRKLKIEAVLTDLRILSGPNQPDYPPISTKYVYGLKLVYDIGSEQPNLPVIGYSRFLDLGSPTRTAVDRFLSDAPSNLLNIYRTPIEPLSATRHILHTFSKFLSAAQAGTTLAQFTNINPPQVIEL